MSPRYVPLAVARPGIGAFYRLALHPRVPTRASRQILELGARSQVLPRGTVVRPTRLGGRPAERISVGATERARTILYLHGGGYTIGSLNTHRSAACFLAQAAAAVVYTLDYRLAPEHPYPAALDDAVAAASGLVDGFGVAPGLLALAGDSAGGGLAVAATRRLIDERGVRPGALALFSPWTDLADDDRSAPRDLVVNAAWGVRNARLYAADTELRDPGLSPRYGRLAGLPPMWVQVGRGELLYRQIGRFVDAARGQGVEVRLSEHPSLWHSGHTQAGLVREAADVVAEAGGYLKQHLRAVAAMPL